MSEHATHWRRIAGDELIYDGPCIVRTITVKPDANHDWADIYDGRDATTGTKYCRVSTANRTTGHLNLGTGVLFGKGIYVNGYDSKVETTVSFIPLDK